MPFNENNKYGFKNHYPSHNSPFASNYNRNYNIQERQRSRNNHHNNINSNQNKHTFFNKKQNKDNHQNQSKQYADSPKIARQVFPIDIGNPKIYLVWKYDKTLINQSNKRLMNFKANIIKSSKPPLKLQADSSRLSELKNQITPVQQVWGQMIKQYLNDSQFVQIYRKKNSLAYGNVEYSKSIIKYDGQNKKKFYDNKQSQYNIFSRAYFKLWEILSLGILQSKRSQDINIANLAEGPGGFVHSLIDFRFKQNKTLQDRYYAITLKIQEGKTRNAKDWSDYRGNAFFEKITQEGYKVELSYGQTGDGNLYNIQNIDSFKTHVMQGRQAFLVTGDGGIQCIGDDQFHYQQIFNAKLFFSEIITAIRIQELGGAFILKIYDIHFQITAQLIKLLCVFYRKVGLIKPLTSRPGNSQKYVLCQGFLGIDKDQLQTLTQLLRQWHKTQNKLSYFQNVEYLQSILQFLSDESKICEFEQTVNKRIKLINGQLSKQQQNKIEQGLQLIKRHEGNKQSIKSEIRQKRLDYQVSYAYQWCKKYGLKHIDVKIIKKDYV